VIASHTLQQGDLSTEEARLVFAMNKHKKIEDEHRKRMGEVKRDEK
jgi:hypothetical protein